MLCKGSQRGGGLDLALHLLNDRDNDHVEVHEMRGVAAHNLTGAFLEIEASAACTRAANPFFSVQLSPPPGSHIEHDHAAYEQAAALIEKEFPDLANQPRAIVFHEKNGRRHGHVVWSRIDTERMKAVQLSHDWPALQRVSRTMYREHGLEMPAGYSNRSKADPLNYPRPVWQQAKRLGEDPRDLMKIIQETYKHSDGVKAFASRLENNGLMLARGDRRGFVVVHHTGEALGLSRYLGKQIREKDIRGRLGDPAHCITVDQAREQLRGRMTASAEKQVEDVKRRHAHEAQPLRKAVLELREVQRVERQALKEMQEARTAQEALARAERLRTGIRGLWDRFTGQRGRVVRQNHDEDEAARARDLKQAQEQIKSQLDDRRQIQARIGELDARQVIERNQARAVLGHWLNMDKDSVRHAVQEHAAEIEQAKEGYKAKQRQGRQDMRALFKTEATPEQQRKKDEFARDLKERSKRTRDDKGMDRER